MQSSFELNHLEIAYIFEESLLYYLEYYEVRIQEYKMKARKKEWCFEDEGTCILVGKGEPGAWDILTLCVLNRVLLAFDNEIHESCTHALINACEILLLPNDDAIAYCDRDDTGLKDCRSTNERVMTLTLNHLKKTGHEYLSVAIITRCREHLVRVQSMLNCPHTTGNALYRIYIQSNRDLVVKRMNIILSSSTVPVYQLLLKVLRCYACYPDLNSNLNSYLKRLLKSPANDVEKNIVKRLSKTEFFILSSLLVIFPFDLFSNAIRKKLCKMGPPKPELIYDIKKHIMHIKEVARNEVSLENVPLVTRILLRRRVIDMEKMLKDSSNGLIELDTTAENAFHFFANRNNCVKGLPPEISEKISRNILDNSDCLKNAMAFK